MSPKIHSGVLSPKLLCPVAGWRLLDFGDGNWPPPIRCRDGSSSRAPERREGGVPGVAWVRTSNNGAGKLPAPPGLLG